MTGSLEIAERILELTRRLETVHEESPAGRAIHAEITQLREAMVLSVDDPDDMKRRLNALRAEAERIRNRRINLYRQMGGDASGGASRDAAVTVGLNKKMDAAAGLQDIESKIERLERILAESDTE